MITFSTLERASRCPASFSLQQVYSTNKHAERGTAIHDYILGHRDLERVPDELRDLCSSIQLQVTECETSFAINHKTGAVRRLGQHLGRIYILDADEIAGTIDGTLDEAVVEIKTGHAVTPARDNLQLRAGCYAVSRWRCIDEVEGAIVYIREDGSQYVDTHRFTAMELDSFPELLRGVVLAVQLAENHHAPPVTTGEHCKYCPAFTSCPAKVGLARAIFRAPERLGDFSTMTLESAGDAWHAAKTLEKVLEKVLESLKEWAKREFIPLRNGKVLAPVESTRASIDGKRALQLLTERGATADEIASCHRITPVVQVREIRRPV